MTQNQDFIFDQDAQYSNGYLDKAMGITVTVIPMAGWPLYVHNFR
jgi:hypothetical protein